MGHLEVTTYDTDTEYWKDVKMTYARELADQLAGLNFGWETEETPKPIRVKYTLSRALTYAERERFREFFVDEAGWDKYYDYTFSKKADVVTFETNVDSRELTVILSDFVEKEFLNVYPKSAGTLSPKVAV